MGLAGTRAADEEHVLAPVGVLTAASSQSSILLIEGRAAKSMPSRVLWVGKSAALRRRSAALRSRLPVAMHTLAASAAQEGPPSESLVMSIKPRSRSTSSIVMPGS